MTTAGAVATDLGPRRMLVGDQWVEAASGATLATEDPSTGRTIFAGARSDMRIVQEEIFGPVLAVLPFEGLDDLPRLGNVGNYGLGAGLYTRDVGTAHRGAWLLDVGNVWVNCYGLRDKSLPFGGFKQSGWGRENGPEGLDAFLESKAVHMKL